MVCANGVTTPFPLVNGQLVDIVADCISTLSQISIFKEHRGEVILSLYVYLSVRYFKFSKQ